MLVHNDANPSAENVSHRQNPVLFSELMFGKSPKRRRVQPATTQSKLHHFFSKPVKKAECSLSQSSSQFLNGKINPSRKCELLKENQVNSNGLLNKNLTSPFEKPKNLLQALNNTQELKRDSVLRDIGNSISSVDNKGIEKESRLFSDENLQSKLAILSKPKTTNPKDADYVRPDAAQMKQNCNFTSVPDSMVGHQSSLAQEESLNSNDVNTLPFSAIIGEASPSKSKCDKKDELERNSAAGSCFIEEETLEEMNTNDVNTIPSSLVINKISSYRSLREEPTEEEPTEEEPTEEEMNTCDVMTLPSSFIVGGDSKPPEDKALFGDTKTSACSAQIKEGTASSYSKQSCEKAEPKEESGKVHDTQTYMDKVWAMFESDSDEEPNTEAITKAADKEKSGTKEFGNVNLSVPQESQLEELNTADFLSAEYSAVIGGGTSKSRQAETERRGEVNCSDFSETVDEINSLTEEDSLTLDNFCGMRGPDSVFS